MMLKITAAIEMHKLVVNRNERVSFMPSIYLSLAKKLLCFGKNHSVRVFDKIATVLSIFVYHLLESGI